jgi:hypothetical protein
MEHQAGIALFFLLHRRVVALENFALKPAETEGLAAGADTRRAYPALALLVKGLAEGLLHLTDSPEFPAAAAVRRKLEILMAKDLVVMAKKA